MEMAAGKRKAMIKIMTGIMYRICLDIAAAGLFAPPVAGCEAREKRNWRYWETAAMAAMVMLIFDISRRPRKFIFIVGICTNEYKMFVSTTGKPDLAKT